MPLRPRSFFASESFSETLLDSYGRVLGEPNIYSKLFARNILRRVYLLILQKIYGIQQKSYCTWHRTVRDPKTGLNQHFRLKTNQQFVDVETIGNPPELSDTEQRYPSHHHEPGPLSIKFRFDEKRFDVDGAHDIAHEIVKSRIDKTRVRGGKERLTQPLRIAMIYSTQNELQEILRHVELLQHETFLTDEAEYLELEDLTDIQKLHAVRVKVNVESAALAQQVGIK